AQGLQFSGHVSTSRPKASGCRKYQGFNARLATRLGEHGEHHTVKQPPWPGGGRRSGQVDRWQATRAGR
ncbi:MAG: hypothetical protein ACK55I_34470, partial [bacterium]